MTSTIEDLEKEYLAIEPLDLNLLEKLSLEYKDILNKTYFENAEYEYIIANVLHSIGLASASAEKYKEAIRYLKKFLVLANHNNPDLALLKNDAYAWLGISYFGTSQYLKAWFYLKQHRQMQNHTIDLDTMLKICQNHIIKRLFSQIAILGCTLLAVRALVTFIFPEYYSIRLGIISITGYSLLFSYLVYLFLRK